MKTGLTNRTVRRCLYFACLLLETSLSQNVLAKKAIDYIDPFIGTGNQGKTFPGATTPGGMVQLSPDTITGGDNGSGYRHNHTTIQGFSLTHMSGVGWYGDLGNFLVMPTTGPLKTWWGVTGKPGTGYLSRFSNHGEIAQAGYYAVSLEDYDIRAEMTAAPHSGFLKFTFPKNPQSRIQIDLARRIGGTSLDQYVKMINDQSIEGWIKCTPEGGGWGHGAGHASYMLYFHAEFSRPVNTFGTWNTELPLDNYQDALEKPAFIAACKNAKVFPMCREMEGQHVGFYAEFSTHSNEVVFLKTGISFVSIQGARENLRKEIPQWDFEKVHQRAKQSWSTALKLMEVEGGTENQKYAYYTALYHALLDPRILADVNGDYPGGDGQNHSTKLFTKRTIFSGWDVYRSEFPLLTIIEPDTVNDMINSFVQLAEQNGTHYFDRWELLNNYTHCMNGSPAVVVINDAFQKGIRGFDLEKAYRFSVNSLEHDNNGKFGYRTDGPFTLSETLEIDNDEWNLSELARGLGHKSDSDFYANQAQDYRKVFDPDAPWTYDHDGIKTCPDWRGWFRARNEDGTWVPWAGLESDKTVQEASVYQQGWLVPYDMPGLMGLLGGNELMVAKLTDFFERTPDPAVWSPYYNQPNEPVHLIPFIFNRIRAPWLTQKWVRIIDAAYKNGPDGLCGDEDVGQMSAWFVLAASGIHQACPGDPRYEIFSPLFNKITFRLNSKYGKGKTFIITAKNNSSENIYIQSLKLNGQPMNRCWISHQEIMSGGQLDMILGPQPNKKWGMASQ